MTTSQRMFCQLALNKHRLIMTKNKELFDIWWANINGAQYDNTQF